MAEPFQDQRELLVIVIRDPALRCALVGELSLEGESLLTLDAAQLSRAIEPISPRPAILITDVDGPADEFHGLRMLYPWDLILVTNDLGQIPHTGGPLLVVGRRDALTLIPAALANWRREHHPEVV